MVRLRKGVWYNLRDMILRLRWWTRLGLWGVFGAFLTVVAIFGVNVVAENSAENIEHIVVIYDRGEKLVIKTEQKTVGEVLSEVGVETNEGVVVEPGLEEEILADNFSINVYRSRPVVVRDGGKKVKVLTAIQDPRLVAEAAGLNLRSEDEVEMKVVVGGSLEVGASSEYVVERAKKVIVELYGRETDFWTLKETVGEFLEEKGIGGNEADYVDTDRGEKVVDGMRIRVMRNGKITVSEEMETEFEVREVLDYDRERGWRQVEEEGVKGKKIVTYEIESYNGEEVGRTIISEVETVAAKPQVVRVGAKVPTPQYVPNEEKEAIMRAAGVAESDFGYVDYIISRESGWGYTKWNYSGSGAYGLCQALPASKMASAGADYMTNPVTQLRWCSGYAVGRYGSWAGAYEFWIKKHWW